MNRPYVHGYDHRENLRLQDQASTLVELLHSEYLVSAGLPCPGSRLRRGGTDHYAREEQPGGSDYLGRYFRGVAYRGEAKSGGRGCHKRQFSTGRHLPPAVQARVVRPRFRLLRPGAPPAAGRGAADVEKPLEARRHDYGDRRRSRLGLFSSRQPIGSQGDSMSGGIAAPGRRKRHDRPRTLSALVPSRLQLRSRLSAHGLRRFEQAATGRGFHQENAPP